MAGPWLSEIAGSIGAGSRDVAHRTRRARGEIAGSTPWLRGRGAIDLLAKRGNEKLGGRAFAGVGGRAQFEILSELVLRRLGEHRPYQREHMLLFVREVLAVQGDEGLDDRVQPATSALAQRVP